MLKKAWSFHGFSHKTCYDFMPPCLPVKTVAKAAQISQRVLQSTVPDKVQLFSLTTSIHGDDFLKYKHIPVNIKATRQIYLAQYLQYGTYSQVALAVENPLATAGDIRDASLIPGLRRSPEGGHGNPFQYSCLENPMDRGAWQAAVHRAVQSQTWLKQLSTHTYNKKITILDQMNDLYEYHPSLSPFPLYPA